MLAGPFAETEYCTTVQEKIAGNPNIITTGYVVGDALLELYSNCACSCCPATPRAFRFRCWRRCRWG